MELEGFSFTLPEKEAAAVYLMLTAAGFPATSQGLKDYVRLKAKITSGEYDDVREEEAADETNAEDLSDKFRKIIALAEQNPEVTRYALKKGTELFGSLLKSLK